MYQLGETATSRWTVRTVVTLYELQIIAQLAVGGVFGRTRKVVTPDPKRTSVTNATKLVESERSAVQSDQNWD